jgi:hypothetical protein
VKRSPISAIRAILILFALGCGFSGLLARSAQAATVFSNYTGNDNGTGFQEIPFVAVGFTSTGNYDFIGAAAFLQNGDTSGNPQPLSIALYSSTSTGAPGSSLWTSGTLDAPPPAGSDALVSASYGGSPILLQSGQSYFLVLNLSMSDAPSWLAVGSSSTPVFRSDDGISWTGLPRNSLQFQVFGAPVAVIPEPTPWAMLLLGFAGLGFAASRRARSKGGVREAISR